METSTNDNNNNNNNNAITDPRQVARKYTNDNGVQVTRPSEVDERRYHDEGHTVDRWSFVKRRMEITMIPPWAGTNIHKKLVPNAILSWPSSSYSLQDVKDMMECLKEAELMGTMLGAEAKVKMRRERVIETRRRLAKEWNDKVKREEDEAMIQWGAKEQEKVEKAALHAKRSAAAKKGVETRKRNRGTDISEVAERRRKYMKTHGVGDGCDDEEETSDDEDATSNS